MEVKFSDLRAGHHVTPQNFIFQLLVLIYVRNGISLRAFCGLKD
jgi:hypothetical protein